MLKLDADVHQSPCHEARSGICSLKYVVWMPRSISRLDMKQGVVFACSNVCACAQESSSPQSQQILLSSH